MHKLTVDEKKVLWENSNKLLAKIPGYSIVMDWKEIDYSDIYKNENGYTFRVLMERNEYSDTYLGKTLEDAIKSLAKRWVYLYAVYYGEIVFPDCEYSDMRKVKEFVAANEKYLK